MFRPLWRPGVVFSSVCNLGFPQTSHFYNSLCFEVNPRRMFMYYGGGIFETGRPNQMV
jgi:hypothetical protein